MIGFALFAGVLFSGVTCPLELEAPPCVGAWISIAEVERSICVELESAALTSTVTQISFAETKCDPATTELRAVLSTGERLSIPLADVEPEHRPRVAALSILEHLRVTPVTPAVTATVATREPERTTSIATVEPAAPIAVRRPIALAASASARFVPRYDQAMFGARAAITSRVLPSFDAAFELGIEKAAKHHPLGELSLGLASAAFAFRWTALGRIHLGPRLELGYAWAEGIAASPDTIARSTFGLVVLAGAEVRATLPLAGPMFGALSLDAGYTIRGLDSLAAGDRAVGLGELYAGATAGLGLEL